MTYRTPQEEFWAGPFGDDYIGRNRGADLLASNLVFFADAMKRAVGVRSCLEFGANVGMNLKALKLLQPSMEQWGIEINPKAARELGEQIGADRVFTSSILDFRPARTWDLVLVKTVLIHMAPAILSHVYQALHASAARYLLVAEYYSPVPVGIEYRGHSDRLFKRDFAGELIEAFPDLRLVDYGFVYRRDPMAPQDDITWFMLEKNQDLQASVQGPCGMAPVGEAP